MKILTIGDEGAFSRYMPEITQFALDVKAKAVYCFVIDGTKGTGGCPLILGADANDPKAYEARNRELVAMLRRSADMLEGDLKRQGFGKGSP